jgi:hypothetical protein
MVALDEKPSECGSSLPLLKTFKIHGFHPFIESGSKLPHSEGALQALKLRLIFEMRLSAL